MKKDELRNNKLKLGVVVLLFLVSTTFAVAQTITGSVSSSDGPLLGASILEKGTANGTQADFDGNFSITVANNNAVLIISYIGYSTKEISVKGRQTLDVILEENASGLDEVVVVGYGTQKKSNLTGAISVVSSEVLEDRPVANAMQALQGASPNLQITTSNATGEPGAGMNVNLRGLSSFAGGSTSPLVLVDGIPMGINDIDPNDIETVSVLKDVASSAIYGARAAYGVILITTKRGKKDSGVKFSYSTNYALNSLLNMPENADALSFAHTMNQARANMGAGPYFNDDALDRIAQNVANPGSAPEVLPTPNGLAWNLGVDGLNASAATDWESLLFKSSGSRVKHNLSMSGGGEDVTFYVSGGLYEEEGLLKQGEDTFDRYNIDAKISAKISPWANFDFLAKYKYEKQEYPDHAGLGRSFVMLLMTRLKPTKPAFFPGTDVWTGRVGEQELHRAMDKRRQLVISPRLTLEPIKGWVTNIDINYRTNDNQSQSEFPTVPSAVPDGLGGSIITSSSRLNTRYQASTSTNTYLSPNIYSNYSKSYGNHNFNVMAGYQQEVYNYFNLNAQAFHLLTDAIPSISTAVGESTVSDGKGHWSTQGVFGRFKYNFDEKYLLELNIRRDGSSRFEPGKEWGTFPSASAGWVVSKEKFYPFKNQIEFLKFRGSYGSVGNQDVANYLYIPNLPTRESNWLFGGERLWTVGIPNLSSVDLTWDKVNTLNLGVDIQAIDNRLGVTFEWYKTVNNDLVGPGLTAPAVLGTSVPLTNAGEITTKGWEAEVSWKNTAGELSYGFRGVLSDYRRRVTEYNNPTKLLNAYHVGQELGEIWGMETAGLFQSEDDVSNWPVDQSYIYSGNWFPGDVKYVDITGDNAIDIGDNTRDNPGDRKIIGNSTPRYQFGVSANASWKGIDVSFLVQGVAKRDLDLRGLGTFRGPANGPLHANVYKEHLDYFRPEDTTNPLGANTDAYFPNSYSQFTGQNNKNYRFTTTRYLQNGAYTRLKNVQLGYTLPTLVSQKLKISKARLYVSGENLMTFTDLMIYDPEAFNGRTGRTGDQYPLSKVYSLGLTINF